jgi:hypothetical protein
VISRFDLRIVIKIFNFGRLPHQFEAFDIQTGDSFVMAAIVNRHFMHREVAHMLGLIAATLGGNVNQRLIKIGEKFKICFYRHSLRHVLR